jgi:DNA-binding NarL/FixJ family response regulator
MTHECSLRVVIVDDDAVIRDALHELLVEEGIDVVGIAEDGIEGVSLALELQPDVVVMDMRMPVLDGLAATTQLKHVRPAMRVVVLTAYDDASLRQNAMAAGADAFVVKGTASENLIDSLRPSSPEPFAEVTT